MFLFFFFWRLREGDINVSRFPGSFKSSIRSIPHLFPSKFMIVPLTLRQIASTIVDCLQFIPPTRISISHSWAILNILKIVIWLICAAEVETVFTRVLRVHIFKYLMKGWPQVKDWPRWCWVTSYICAWMDQVGWAKVTCINDSSYAQVYFCCSRHHP